MLILIFAKAKDFQSLRIRIDSQNPNLQQALIFFGPNDQNKEKSAAQQDSWR